jgi:hypothetical protein
MRNMWISRGVLDTRDENGRLLAVPELRRNFADGEASSVSDTIDWGPLINRGAGSVWPRREEK